ncbi:MAG TPA: transporter substrate-binding domain-containing protein [Trueperaceae bacterium]
MIHDSSTIRFCLDTREPEWELHRDIGTAIADALLLDVEFFEFGYDYADAARQFQGVPENLLFIFLGDECEAFLGTRMSDISVHPDWVIVSRPYLVTGHVLASSSPEALEPANVLDNPDGPKVGMAVGSPMNASISFYFPDTNRRVYRQEEQLLDGLLRGEVQAGFFYEPRLNALTGGDPASVGLETRVFAQVPATNWQVGMSLNEDRVYIRTLIDQAIASLIANGTIAEILARHGLDDSLLTAPAAR